MRRNWRVKSTSVGPSLEMRWNREERFGNRSPALLQNYGNMLKSEDRLVLETSVERRVGASPSIPTKFAEVAEID